MALTLSILGLYQLDNTVFNNLHLPAVVNKEVLIANLLSECSEYEIIYPDLPFMKMILDVWSFKELPIWEKLAATLNLEYNPIHNYDRTEEWVEEGTRNTIGNEDKTRELTGNDLETYNLKHNLKEYRDLTKKDIETRMLKSTDNTTRDLTADTHTDVTTHLDTKNSGSDTAAVTVAGFNSDSLVPRETTTNTLGSSVNNSGNDVTDSVTTDSGTIKAVLDDTGTLTHDNTDTGTITHDNADTGTLNRDKNDKEVIQTNQTENDSSLNKRLGRAYGNIGVTTTQQMITQEREVVQFSLYDFIIDSFKKRFCLLVY